MVKRKEEPPKKGSSNDQTFGDLMNLLLCFFVLLFSMSSVDSEKYEQVVASLQSVFRILPSGGTSIEEEGSMISSGVSQLKNLDVYYKEGNSGDTETTKEENKDVKEQFEEAALKESEEMAEKMETMISQRGIDDKVEIDVNRDFIKITLNGALLFDSGKSEFREDALPLVKKLGDILELYAENQINIVGHTDNVPINNAQFESNDVLAVYRALSIKDYLVENMHLEPAKILSATQGEYSPVTDNLTEEGRARNRRVEIHIYNSYF